MNNSEELASLLRESIAASNRTTRAVRAFVRFIFIQFFTGLAVAVPWALGLTLGEAWLLVVAFLVALVGLIWASTVGFDELSKSDPDTSMVQSNESEENRLADSLAAFRKTAATFEANENAVQKSD
jgi:hypothetical protein